MAEPPVPQRSRSRPGSRCAEGRSALRSPALPLDMPHLGRSRWTYAHCAHRHGLGLDMPDLGAQQPRWTCPTVAAAAGHMPIVLIGTGSDWTCPPVGRGAPAGHAPPSPQPLDICPLCSSVRARTGHVQRLARRALLQLPRLSVRGSRKLAVRSPAAGSSVRRGTRRRAASLKAAGASSSKGNWGSECLLVKTFSRSGVKDFGAVPPGLWRTPHGDANHERNLPSGIRRYPQAPWPQSG